MTVRCELPLISPKSKYKPLPARSPGGHRTEIDSLNARIEQLQAELARLEVEKRCLEACAAGHRADFEHERKRLDTLMTEALKLAHFAMSAREKAARLEGELSAAWARRRWWRRLVSPISRPAVRFEFVEPKSQCS